MRIVGIIIAVLLGLLVLKFVFGLIKFVLLAVIVLAVIGFLAKKVP